MQDGTEIFAKKAILANTNPYHTFLELLPGFANDSNEKSPLPDSFKKHIQFSDYSCGAFKINLAVDKLPKFSCNVFQTKMILNQDHNILELFILKTEYGRNWKCI